MTRAHEHPRWARSPILWVWDAGDLAKLPQWLAARDQDGLLARAVEIAHPDTGAYSIALFTARRERRGIIRCATAALADAVLHDGSLPPYIVSVTGGNDGLLL